MSPEGGKIIFGRGGGELMSCLDQNIDLACSRVINFNYLTETRNLHTQKTHNLNRVNVYGQVLIMTESKAKM